MTQRETSAEIDDAAARWAARAELAPLSEAEQQELDRWLEGDRRRLGAYGKARAVLARTDRARALGPNFDPEQFAPPREVSRRRFLWMGGGAAAAAASVAGVLGFGLLRSDPAYATALGEIRRVPLSDGSVVTLNTASRIVVAYRERQRTVRLVEGEALFEVTRNAARPFVVLAGGAEVRALGTAFTVRHTDQHTVQVLVREGQVELLRRNSDAAPAPPVRVAENSRVVDRGGSAAIVPQRLNAEEVSRELSWRVGRIALNGVTLQEAAAEFARYSATPIIVDDPMVARRKVTGLYSATDPEGFARAVATVLDLRASATPQGIRISPPTS